MIWKKHCWILLFFEMWIFRDMTEDFKDSVREADVSNGYNESKLASTMGSFIMHKPKERSPFTTAAFKKELNQFMMKHRKDYVDLHWTTEVTEKWRGSGSSPFLRVYFQVDISAIGVTNFEGSEGKSDVEVFDPTHNDYIKIMKLIVDCKPTRKLLTSPNFTF